MTPTLWLHSARLGPATNSSSTHSILVFDTPPDAADDADARDQCYGWSDWTAATPQAKLAWLGQALREQVHAAVCQDDTVSAAVVERLFAHLGHTVTIDADGSVDHDSRFDLPLGGGYAESPLREQLLRQVLDFLADARVVVIGGNDNKEPGEPPHPLAAQGRAFTPWRLFEETRDPGSIPLRWDARDEYWAVASGEGVSRFRWAVDPGPAVTRSEVPELVDVSVGNHCATGCRYCYRGSTTDQAFASASEIVSAVDAFQTLGTFEIALGGGDPMQHPELLALCESLGDALERSGGRTRVHVTTRETAWLRDPPLRDAALRAFTAFGLSVDSLAALRRTHEAFEAAGVKRARLNFQVVAGVPSQAMLVRMLDYAREHYLRVTLLGYKTTGFGDRVQPKPLDPSILKGRYHIGVDTVLAQAWEPWLVANHAWQGSYALREGAFSCFYDVVTRRLHRSSYDRSEGIEVKGRGYGIYQEMRAAYQRMQVEAGL
jgi:hypothetical protein